VATEAAAAAAAAVAAMMPTARVILALRMQAP
jgi:hypothetical protein